MICHSAGGESIGSGAEFTCQVLEYDNDNPVDTQDGVDMWGVV